MSRQHTALDGDGADGDGRSRGGFDPGSQGTDHYGDGGDHNGGRHHSSSNANGNGNSPSGVDNDGSVENPSSSSKNLSGAKNSQSPVSQESVDTSHGSNLKADPSTSIDTASELYHLLVLRHSSVTDRTVLADAPSPTSIPRLKDSSSSSSSSFPITRISINTLGVATSSNATPLSAAIPSSAATSTNFIAPQTNLSKRSNYGAIAGGSVGALVVVLLVLAAWVLYKRWNKNRPLPSDEFVNTSAASYPFAHAGFSYTISGEEKKQKNEMTDGIYHGTRTNPAGQAEFKPSFAVVVDPAQSILPEEEESKAKESQPGDYCDMNTTSQQSRLPASQPEVLYATPPPPRIVVTSPAASGTPTVPRTPQGRRVPFGTGTFQFPRRPPESQGLGQGNPP